MLSPPDVTPEQSVPLPRTILLASVKVPHLSPRFAYDILLVTSLIQSKNSHVNDLHNWYIMLPMP